MKDAQESKVIQLLTEIRDLLAHATPVGARPAERTQTKTSPGAPTRHKAASGTRAPLDVLLDAQDAEDWAAIWDCGSALEKWIAVLAIGEEEVGVGTALTAGEIERILKDRFRINGVHAPNINRDLKKARTYVNRKPRGAGFEYSLTRAGLKWITQRRTALRETGKARE